MERKQITPLTERQKSMVEDNINLIHHILKKSNFGNVSADEYDDYFQQGAYGLCLAAKSFDESKGFEFSTLACTYILGYLRRYYRDFAQGPIRPTRSQFDKKQSPTYLYYNKAVNYDDNTDSEILEFLHIESSDSNFDNETVSDIDFERFSQALRERDKNVVELARQGATQIEIAKVTGISQAQVSRIKKKLQGLMLLKKVV